MASRYPASDRLKTAVSFPYAIELMGEGDIETCRLCKNAATRANTMNPCGQPDEPGWDFLTTLDTHRIYGRNLRALCADICGGDPGAAVVIVKAVQEGLLGAAELKRLILQHRPVDIGPILADVRQRLPTFAPNFRPRRPSRPAAGGNTPHSAPAV